MSEHAELLQELRAQVAERAREAARARELYEQAMSAYPAPPEVTLERVDVAGVPGAWVRGPGAGDGVILYLHGGGFTTGSVSSHQDCIGRLARASGARVLGIDYGLLPEHPFPDALEDTVTGYRWLRARGTDSSRIVVAGNSSGANLAMSAALALRERGEPPPAGVLCLCPWVDMTLSAPSLDENETHDWFGKEGLAATARLYLDGRPANDPLVSPVHARLRGLPPLMVQAAEEEMLVDDARNLARVARQQGLDVTLDLWPGLFHNWQLFAGRLPEGRRALRRAGEWVRRQLAPQHH